MPDDARAAPVPRSAADDPAPERVDAALRLGSFLPYRLSVLSNTVSSAIARVYAEEFGLTVWQWRVMAILGESDGLTAQEVTARTAMDKMAVSRAVSGLIEAGRLRRRASASDGRAAHLHLTAKGRRDYAEIAPRALAYERRLLAGLSADERAVLTSLLDKLDAAAAAEAAP